MAEARRFLGLGELRPLSREEHKFAGEICAKIGDLARSRPVGAGVTASFARPDGDWEVDAHNKWFFDICRLVVSGDYDAINLLRLYSEAFSGYDLKTKSFAPFIPPGEVCEKPRFRISPTSADEIRDAWMQQPDSWVERFRRITRHLPRWVVKQAPARLGEIGWEVGGHPVNYDVYSCQERLNFLYEAGVLTRLKRKAAQGRRVTIVEIGAGYGALAEHLTRILTNACYIVCDIPESLLFAALYLGILRGRAGHAIYDGGRAALHNLRSGFLFLPNFFFDDLVTAGIETDLAINTLSFGEMTEHQVRHYAHGLRAMLGDGGVLFEQNMDLRKFGWATPSEILGEVFPYREEVRSRTVVERRTMGQPTLWAASPIDAIIRRGFRPYEGIVWRTRFAAESFVRRGGRAAIRLVSHLRARLTEVRSRL